MQGMQKLIPITQMPLSGRHWYLACVASLEQVIGAALSTVVGIIIPLMNLLGTPHVSSFYQGLLGASGLIGIAVGSMIIGKLMDKTGYLFWFRICPALIMAGAAGVYLNHDIWPMAFFLFVAGLGVGGGYSLDSGYISELMPERWINFFVGLAKAASALGFIGGAAAGYLIILMDPKAASWPYLMLFIGILGAITLILRIRWYQSPAWLMAQNRDQEAQKAAKEFFGPNAEMPPLPPQKTDKTQSWSSIFKGEKNLQKIWLSGITWACEGLGVYGFGVFLPILVMALGLQTDSAEGIARIMESVKTSAFINLFIAAGFAAGLCVLHKVNIIKLMGWCFTLCGLALTVLLLAHNRDWPVWISFLCFVIFEVALNAGPHLVTYVIPAKIYSVEERGAGTGVATLFGKLGAIAGVFFIPCLLNLGGVTLVLGVSIAIQFIGAAITFIYGKKLNLL